MAYDSNFINKVLKNSGRELQDNALVSSYKGLNINPTNGYIPPNQEHRGYTFFTRPALNLTDRNILPSRVMSGLLTESNNTMQQAVRLLLDPRLYTTFNYRSPVVDEFNPFIPILSNNLISLTGWRDFTTQTHTTEQGLYREAMSYVDDVPYDYEVYDLTANFRNIAGNPITYLNLIWGWYMALVHEGALMPYPDMVLLNELDYNTRIWRITLDATRTRVVKVACCGAGFPINSPVGNELDFTGDGSETPFQSAQNQVSITFRCMGTRYYDWILNLEFNQCVKNFNKWMRDEFRESMMVKLDPWEYNYFNSSPYTYPRINTETMEFEWWVSKERYKEMADSIVPRRTYQDNWGSVPFELGYSN